MTKLLIVPANDRSSKDKVTVTVAGPKNAARDWLIGAIAQVVATAAIEHGYDVDMVGINLPDELEEQARYLDDQEEADYARENA